MNQWVLIGILALLAADYVQIVEEWKTRGLTDTSYKVLVLLVSAPAMIAYGFYSLHSLELAVVFGMFAVFSSLMLLLKLKDTLLTRFRLLR
jgi:hypothetical protein